LLDLTEKQAAWPSDSPPSHYPVLKPQAY
jgi:hypothetical protein